MRAIVFRQYGPPDVLKLQEVKKPTPKDSEVLIRMLATPVNFADTLIRNFKEITPKKFHMPFLFWLIGKFCFGFTKPRITILGSEFSGKIEAVGKDVQIFKKGDPVFGYCGPTMGAYAEYLCMPEKGVLAIKPTNMNNAEAAAVPYGAIMALGVLRKVNIQSGQKVLINGASGGIGALLVQLAKHFGAEVTGVCSTPRMALVKKLGADLVIDYTKEDFTQNRAAYDHIFDILGKSSFAKCKNSLKQNGRYVLVSFKMKQVFQMIWTAITGSKKVVCALSNERAEDLVFIKELIEAGKIIAVIDQCFPLEQAAAAHWYAEKGQKKGTVIITSEHLNT